MRTTIRALPHALRADPGALKTPKLQRRRLYLHEPAGLRAPRKTSQGSAYRRVWTAVPTPQECSAKSIRRKTAFAQLVAAVEASRVLISAHRLHEALPASPVHRPPNLPVPLPLESARAAQEAQPLSRVRNETQLITRVLAGEARAGREFYEAYAPRIYRLIYRLCGDEDLAQDFTQEAFIRAFNRLGHFRGDAALSTWLHRIALTVSANGMRKVRQRRSRESEIDPDLPAAPETNGADRSQPDLRAKLRAAIDNLPEIYRTALVMHDIEGYTHTEIASILDLPEGTCKRRLFTARAQLRRVLAPFTEEHS